MNGSNGSERAVLVTGATYGIGIDDFMAVFNINIGWNFLMAREAVRQMREKGRARSSHHRNTPS